MEGWMNGWMNVPNAIQSTEDILYHMDNHISKLEEVARKDFAVPVQYPTTIDEGVLKRASVRERRQLLVG